MGFVPFWWNKGGPVKYWVVLLKTWVVLLGYWYQLQQDLTSSLRVYSMGP